MNRKPIRENILKHLQNRLEPNPHIQAMWLEGSAGTKSSDGFSDIDLNLAVTDGNELESLKLIQKALEELGTLDHISVITKPNPDQWYQVFHISNTSPHLLIDTCIQSHSRQFSFDKNNQAEIPLVLFDKAHVIQFHDTNQSRLTDDLQQQIQLYQSRIHESSRVEKYLKRGNFLEALAYYQKYILSSVVGLARIIHTPLNSDYGLVKISKHLPPDLVKKLESLYQISSLADIEQKLPQAIKLFAELLKTY